VATAFGGIQTVATAFGGIQTVATAFGGIQTAFSRTGVPPYPWVIHYKTYCSYMKPWIKVKVTPI
jgi:hypothetical protein